jgi:Putative Ig domain
MKINTNVFRPETARVRSAGALAGAILGMLGMVGCVGVASSAIDKKASPISPSATTVTIETTSLTPGTVHAAYAASLLATGGTAPYSWSVSPGTLPAGLALAANGAISGSPSAAGNSSFMVNATDSSDPAQTASQSLNISISSVGSSTLQISTGALATAALASAYSQSLAATGGIAPYHWSVTSGNLPAGLALNAAGAISGTPTTAGSVAFTLQATDASSPAETASKSLSIAVSSSTSALKITTASLGGGEVNSAYSSTLTATGGKTPYKWSIAGGSLPTGLSLTASSGLIAGTPLQSGTSSITAQVTDSSSPAQSASESFSVAIAAAGTGTVVSACGTLGNSGTTYLLTANVSSAGSCFSIQASDITLNLNGYTVTYNTASQSAATYAISGVACWDASNPAGNPCGGTFDNFTVYGGNIVEGSGTAASYAHPIRIGQGLNTGPTIHDVNITWSSDSAVGIYLDYAGLEVPGTAVIYNNTLNNRVTSIQDRADIDGLSMELTQATLTTTPAQIYNNTIHGGPQGGIQSESTGAQIYGNTIEQGTVGSNQYTNDFAIYPWATNQNVHGNTILASQGRGVSIDSSAMPETNTVVQSNNITVIEKSDNGEYGGCELGGTYGVQYDDQASGASDVSNTVVAEAQQCNGGGLRLTAVGTGNTSSNNSYTGKLLSGFTAGVVATGLSMDSGGQPAFTATRDTFIGDTSSIYVDWDGAGPFTCVSCTLGSGPEPSNYTTFYFWNGSMPVTPGGLHFRDTTFTGSASKTSTNMTVPGNNGTTAEYWIDWTYSLTVEDGSGAAVSGASVSIKDALGNNIYSGTTSSSGQISAVVTEFRMHNSGTSATQEMHTPDAVTVSASGCSTLSYSVTVSGTMSDTRSMAATCGN